MTEERFAYEIQEGEQEVSVRDLLKRRMGVSSRLLRKLKQGGGVFLNGRPVRLFEKGRAGDRITIALPEEKSGFAPEDIPLEVLYEDRDLLILNKQPGIVCHPTKGHACHTVANGVQRHMELRGEAYRIRFINRLDMDTSGVLLIGKNSHCQDNFAHQAAQGLVEKKYLAVVTGLVEEEEGVVDLPIDLAKEGEIRRMVREDGYPSVTHYKVLERFGRAFTLLELRLETGRTHQIRVHLAHLGHPVVGDVLYGSPDVWNIERQALHASYLAFRHPVSGVPVEAAAPLPEDMKRLLEKLRA
ncbi:MAG: RluA family pseudouridine synthase [Bacillota bacterium]|nr:RluA family pseudouridine synthase [Bacillota bacterium]